MAAGCQRGSGMTRAEEFESLRPLLFAIAYRMLGSVSDAEDAVQESWLRYAATPTRPASAKAFLSSVVTRIAIDGLRAARTRREAVVGPGSPEPLMTDPYADPERSAELADSVSMAALLIMERLSPLERAVFVLREVFEFGFSDIAVAVGRSPMACRQLAVRARRHVNAGRTRFAADPRKREELAARFFDAFRNGRVHALRAFLTADIRQGGHDDGESAQWHPIIGLARVAGPLAAFVTPWRAMGVVMESVR